MPFPPEVQLAGQRLVLVPLSLEVAAEMLPVLAAPSLYEHKGGSPPSSAELTARYERQLVGPGSADESWLNWTLRAEDRVVGYVQATVRRRGPELAADVAWVVAVDEQGRGVASEAAGVMVEHLLANGCTTVRALIADAHAASAVVARRLGMRRTALVEDDEHVWLLETT